MYCVNCGSEMSEGSVACSRCGRMVAGCEGSRGGGSGESSSTTGGVGHVSYEYVRTSVARELVQVATDCYENLGFELTGVKADGVRAMSTLSFRRSRKIKNKAQLVKLQRTIDDALAGIAESEVEKTRKGTMQSLAMGIASALVLGVGMSCTMVWSGLMIPGIVIGLVGIAGCIAAYFLYRRTCVKETARINPHIETAYDSLATACEEAQAVLRSQV